MTLNTDGTIRSLGGHTVINAVKGTAAKASTNVSSDLACV